MLIFKIDIQKEGSLVPIVEYELYEIKNKSKLNLDICNDITIEILLPVLHVEDDLFKHNSSSKYYTDICYTYTTENGTDIILNDRKNEFINNNLSLCDLDCDYKGYNIEIKMSVCECAIKNEILNISEIVSNKDKLLKIFVDFNNFMNIQLLKCYKLLFSKDGLIKNIGNYIIISIILIIIASFIFFTVKGYKLLYNIIYEIEYLNHKTKKTNDKSQKSNNNKIIKFKNADNKKKKLENIRTKIHKSKETFQKTKHREFTIYKSKEKDKSTKSLSKFEKTKNKFLYNIDLLELDKNNLIKTIIKDNKKINDLNKKKFNDYELNKLKYKDAIKIDKRTYLQYYFSLIRRKQKIIFTFYTSNDYNSRIIKICLFFFDFALYYIVNALFFTDSTVHKIYENKGNNNFIFKFHKCYIQQSSQALLII